MDANWHVPTSRIVAEVGKTLPSIRHGYPNHAAVQSDGHLRQAGELAGQQIDALPYPPPEKWRQHAELNLRSNMSTAVTRAFNQQAIFDRIAGDAMSTAIESLPYPAPESWQQWAISMKNDPGPI